ncbi:MAG: DUF1846 domain-containing protein [Firmicutes bacterium]|nr:DUF1846 domain-containing protein [Bacillota bacterium]
MAFNTEKYIRLQSEKIMERASKFGKLYLEFGGKLFDDNHFSRCMPGFQPDTKIKMLASIKDKVEVIVSIFAEDVESGKKRHDVGLSYESYVIHLVDMFRDVGIQVNSVVINKFEGQPAALLFKRRLENLGIKAYVFKHIDGYPANVDLVLSEAGYGADPFIETTKPIVITTGPGAKSGKMRVALSQLYHELKRGNKVGYAKFETLPVWNLPLSHPVNIAYEASTININDLNMIDGYHLDKYGVVAVNYNRDIEAFPLLQHMFRKMYGEDIYYSPTDMGVNMVGFCIEDMAAAEAASKAEVIRRYYETLCYFKNGSVDADAVKKITILMEKMGLRPTDRAVVVPALAAKEKTNRNSAAIQLKTGEIVSAAENGMTSVSSELLLKTLQKLLGVNSKIKILSDNILQKAIELKQKTLGERKFHLRLGEVLIILSSSALTNELSAHALEQLGELRGTDAHFTYMISDEESLVWKKLGVNLTMEPVMA